MGDTQRSPTISTDNQGIAVQNSDKAGPKAQKSSYHLRLRAAKLCASRGVAWLVDGSVKRAGTEEPYEENLHVRVCGEGAG